MIINVQKGQIQEKLSVASRFTSSKLSSVTALQGVLMKGTKEGVHFYSTDLTLYLHNFLPLKLEEEFTVIVEPRKILEFLQFLPPGEIVFEILEKQIIITQNKTKGNFPLIVSTDFPTPPVIDEKEQKLESSYIKKYLPLVLFAASPDETRPALTGVNFVVSEEDLVLVATDGFRLSLVKIKKEIDIPSMLVPRDFLTEVLRHVKDEKELYFSYSAEEKMVSFRIGVTRFYSRLIEGEFPPYERVIPAEHHTTVTLEKDEFLRNVKLISVFARDYSNVVVCEFKKDGMYVRPKKDSNDENTAFQDVQVEGEEQKVAFNFKFVIDFLNNVDSKNIQVEVLRSDAPVVFRIDKNKDFLHIIMPVRIQE